MKKYNPQKIERKWQKRWYDLDVFIAQNNSKKDKFYLLAEFPYPSGDGLHVGHCRSYTALDIIARKKRMEGLNVLYPIGWDAFGLPTENYAIKMGVHPSVATKRNTDNFRKQMKSLGFSFDWSREINTTDPSYYKWTQWIFLKLFENGLAYKKKMAINWCPKCKIGLANEEVVGGGCERCGTKVEKKEKEQWLVKITEYADRLIKDLDLVDYPERVKIQQKEWIGRSEGSLLKFQIPNSKLQTSSNKRNSNYQNEFIEVFTTRADTIFGCTFLVLAPEHPFVASLLKIKNQKSPARNAFGIANAGGKIKNIGLVEKYINEVKNKSDLERQELKEKTGVELKGLKAINPANKKEIPIFVADYVMTGYGTGAIMAVPAHDERDFEFANKYNLPIQRVVANKDIVKSIVWGDISREEFESIGVEVIEEVRTKNKEYDEVVKKVKFPQNSIEVFEKLIQKKLQVGFWNEYVGPTGIVFNFKNKDGSILRFVLSSENWKDIDKTCYEFFHNKKADANWKPKNVWKWLANAEGGFYKDLIIHSDYGILENSGQFNEISSEKAKDEIVKFVGGKKTVNYKLRDWIFSRQHYWGEPMPLIFCANCKKSAGNPKFQDTNPKWFGSAHHPEPAEGQIPNSKSKIQNLNIGELLNPGWVAVAEDKLPVKLPNMKKYQPTDTGESPLAAMEKWVNVKCPKCGGAAKRETDTMPNWAGSNWYYLAYILADRINRKSKIINLKSKNIFTESKNILKQWLPVDWYNGGMEHTTLHLLYSRFIYKFLWDIGAVPKSVGSEPYKKRTSHGMILGQGGVKMSKSKGNVVNPEAVAKQYGADAFRIYEMFMGPFEQMIPWDDKGVVGTRRFLEKIYTLVFQKVSPVVRTTGLKEKSDKNLKILLDKTIKKVGEDIEAMKFNTAISSLMILVNEFSSSKESLNKEYIKNLLLLLSPFAPHLAEELWGAMEFKGMACLQEWPGYDANLIKSEEVLLIVQVNGKVRDKVKITAGLTQREVEEIVSKNEKIKNWISGKKIKKIIFVRDKLINIVL